MFKQWRSWRDFPTHLQAKNHGREWLPQVTAQVLKRLMKRKRAELFRWILKNHLLDLTQAHCRTCRTHYPGMPAQFSLASGWCWPRCGSFDLECNAGVFVRSNIAPAPRRSRRASYSHGFASGWKCAAYLGWVFRSKSVRLWRLDSG